MITYKTYDNDKSAFIFQPTVGVNGSTTLPQFSEGTDITSDFTVSLQEDRRIVYTVTVTKNGLYTFEYTSSVVGDFFINVGFIDGNDQQIRVDSTISTNGHTAICSMYAQSNTKIMVEVVSTAEISEFDTFTAKYYPVIPNTLPDSISVNCTGVTFPKSVETRVPFQNVIWKYGDGFQVRNNELICMKPGVVAFFAYSITSPPSNNTTSIGYTRLKIQDTTNNVLLRTGVCSPPNPMNSSFIHVSFITNVSVGQKFSLMMNPDVQQSGAVYFQLVYLHTNGVVYGSLYVDDVQTIAAYASMPSTRYENLTLPASDGVVIAPSNGYIYLSKKANGANQYATLYNKTTSIRDSKYVSTTAQVVRLCIPVSGNDEILVNYNLTGDTEEFKFIYANGITV